MAKTLDSLAQKGKSGFYEGPVAEAIIHISQQLGGYLTLADLKEHRSEVVDPVSLKLSLHNDEPSINLWEHPPNGQGIVAQMALGILAELEKEGQIPKFSGEDHNSVPYVGMVPYYVLDTSTDIEQVFTCAHTGPKNCFRRRELVRGRSGFDYQSYFTAVPVLSRSESKMLRPEPLYPDLKTR